MLKSKTDIVCRENLEVIELLSQFQVLHSVGGLHEIICGIGRHMHVDRLSLYVSVASGRLMLYFSISFIYNRVFIYTWYLAAV